MTASPSLFNCFKRKSRHLGCRAILGIVVLTGCQSFRTKPAQRVSQAPASKLTEPLATVEGDESEREVCMQTARLVAENGHFQEAIALYEKAEGLGAKTVPLHRELAPLYAQAGRSDLASQRYQEAIQLDPMDPSLRNNFAWTLLEVDQVERALKVTRDAVTLFPEDQRLAATHALALYRSGDRDESWNVFANALGDSAAHHNIAILDLEYGSPSDAKASLTQALANQALPETQALARAMESESVQQR